MPRKFWNYVEPEQEGSPVTLRIDGVIAEESWWIDATTPDEFQAELNAHPGDINVYINSPGGDVIAGSRIYAMLRDHPGRICVRIDGIAASAASVIAMGGDYIEMAPTAYMMIHNAATDAWGDNRALRQAADMLDEVNKGIRTAYALRTGLDEETLTEMMDAETWMSAPTALANHFIDAMYATPEPAKPTPDPQPVASLYSSRHQRQAIARAIMQRCGTAPLAAAAAAIGGATTPTSTEADDARARLALLLK